MYGIMAIFHGFIPKTLPE